MLLKKTVINSSISDL